MLKIRQENKIMLILIPLALILISSLPLILIVIWIRLSGIPFKASWYFLSILAGTAALCIALALQLVPVSLPNLIRIPLTEELARPLALFLFSRLCRTERIDSSLARIAGLVSGFSFAALESISYGADSTLMLLRAASSTLLHGACGARSGLCVLCLKNAKAASFYYLFLNCIVHGVYNMMVLNPFIPVLFPSLLALFFLASVFVRA
ncbi:PrsW family glutamic-type intramembrane protease [Breznakiellaceae bacterium SP9]